MATARAKSAATKKSAPHSKPASAKRGGLADYLLGPAAAEDAAAYDPVVLAKAGALAEKAVLSHRKGESVIARAVGAFHILVF